MEHKLTISIDVTVEAATQTAAIEVARRRLVEVIEYLRSRGVPVEEHEVGLPPAVTEQ